MNTQSWVSAARMGDLQAFNHLVLEFQDEAYSLAYQILGDETAAAQATQSAMISAYQDLPDFGTGSFRAWLCRQVIQACWDRLVKTGRTKRPRRSLREGSTASRFWGLDDEMRLALAVIDCAGLDYEEAGVALGISTAEVRRRVAQARLQLQLLRQ